MKNGTPSTRKRRDRSSASFIASRPSSPFSTSSDRLPASVANISRITHHDPRSIAGGVAIAKAAQLLAGDHSGSPDSFCEEVASAMQPYDLMFADLVRGRPGLLQIAPEKAHDLIAWSGMPVPEFDEPIITPFVIPTVLASLWCVLGHSESWSSAVASVIRLGGDVDTLGAIVGALMGARLGIGGIPRHLVEAVVDSESLRSLAVRYHALVTEQK